MHSDRILITACEVGPSGSGMAVYAEEVCKRIVPRLIKSGMSVGVALRADAGELIESMRAVGAEIVMLNPTSSPASKKLLEYYYRISKSAMAYDIVHSLDHKIPWWRRRPQKLSLTVHDCCYLETPEEYDFSRRLFFLATERWATKAADAIVTVSNSAGRALAQRLGVLPAKIAVVHNGCDVSQFNSEPNPGDLPILKAHGIEPGYFLFVGRVSPRKNFALIAAAVATLPKKDTLPTVVLAGPQGWRNSNEVAQLKSSNIASHFRAIGFVDRPSLAALYRNAAALLFPSLCEGFGLPVLEALSCGCPVVVTANTASEEIGQPHVLTIDGRTPSQLAEIMQRLALRQIPRPDPMSVKRHLTRFTWDRGADELQAILCALRPTVRTDQNRGERR